MILQRQFSLWKWLGMLLWVSIVIMLWSVLFYKWRIDTNTSIVNKTQVKISNLEQKISDLKNTSELKKIAMADIIKNSMNNTNYVSLYKYLNRLKNILEKDLNKIVWYKKFTLSVRKWEVSISTQVANYSDLYSNDKWIFNILWKKPFVTHISVNSYKTQNNAIYFDLKLKTK